MQPRATLLVVGAASRDLDASDSRGWRLGGTVAYASLAAARLGIAVRALIGVDREAATASELELLRKAGVAVEMVFLERGPVFDNRQTPAGRVQVVHQASDVLPAAALPAEWTEADAVLWGPIAGELGGEWASAIPPHTFVVLTWQGLLRRLVPGQPVQLQAARRQGLVARADAMLLSAEDVSAGADPLRNLLADAQHLLLTHGEHGAAHLQVAGGRLHGRIVPSLPRRAAVDTTGAGDVFLATWLAARLLAPGAPGDRHLALASIASSLKVANHGLDGTPGWAEVCAMLVRLRDA